MFQQLLVRTATALDEAGIAYMVIGAQAVLVYGEPRFTRDIDVTVYLTVSEAPRLADALAAVGIDALEDPLSFVAKSFVLPCVDRTTGLRVDLLFGASVYEQTAIERARSIEIEGYDVRFVSPEDLVIHKVLAGRPRDIDDVLGLLLKQPDLNHRSIRSWLDGFDAELDTDLRRRFDQLVDQAQR